MSRIDTTVAEFNAFWDEVLGNDWYIWDWNIPDEIWDGAGPNEPLAIEYLALSWQGTGDPKPTPWITARMLAGDDVKFAPLFKRWRASRDGTETRLTVRISAEHVAALEAWLAERDGGVIQP